MSIKVIGIVLLAIVVAAGAGWFAGGSGRSVAERERDRSEMRAEFAEAKSLVLAARVSLYQSNFGDAIQQLQGARTLIGRVQARLREMGQTEQAGRLEIALSSLSDAQRLAATFDVTRAQAAADQAMQALQAAAGG